MTDSSPPELQLTASGYFTESSSVNKFRTNLPLASNMHTRQKVVGHQDVTLTVDRYALRRMQFPAFHFPVEIIRFRWRHPARRLERAELKLSRRIEHFDAVVGRVGNDDVIARIDGHVIWIAELMRLTSGLAERFRPFPVRRINTNIVRENVRDDELSATVDRYAVRPAELTLAYLGDRLTGRCVDFDPLELAVRHGDVTVTGDRHTERLYLTLGDEPEILSRSYRTVATCCFLSVT